MAIKMGITIARMDRMVAVMSSARLTGALPAPPVVAVTIGRTAAALTVCTPPAINSPQASARAGCRSVITPAVAAKAIARRWAG